MCEPLTARNFATLMAPFAPFEPKPQLAIAVSGGGDSMALALLAAEWARSRGGRAVALTVDHGLRRESRAEVARVATWLRRWRIAHRVLRWRGPKPAANVQAAARAARYALLEDWCRRRGVLHLLLAHQREDQAETLLLRLARGSGAYGLAAMPAVHERASVRHLRPLLGIGRSELEAALRARNQSWLDDPSNRNESFARARLRGSAKLLAREGASSQRLAATAGHLGRARAALEWQVALSLARNVTLFPEGYVLLDRGAFAHEDAEIGLRALAAALTTVAGADTAPRYESLALLHRDLVGAGPFRGRTLGGCRIAAHDGGRALLIVRELNAVDARPGTTPGGWPRWDARFELIGPKALVDIAPLGERSYADWARADSSAGATLPRLACLPLPSVADRSGRKAVSVVGGLRSRQKPAGAARSALFQVQNPLAGAFFAAAPLLAEPGSTIV